VDAAKLHDKHVDAKSVLKLNYLDLSGLGFLGMGACPPALRAGCLLPDRCLLQVWSACWPTCACCYCTPTTSAA
jgi:ABC-type antimicrobial peptide transport system permease subunit